MSTILSTGGGVCLWVQGGMSASGSRGCLPMSPGGCLPQGPGGRCTPPRHTYPSHCADTPSWMDTSPTKRPLQRAARILLECILVVWWFWTFFFVGGKHVTCYMIFIISSLPFYRPKRSFGQGYIFTGVCDSVHRGGVSNPGGIWSRGVSQIFRGWGGRCLTWGGVWSGGVSNFGEGVSNFSRGVPKGGGLMGG